MSLIRFSNVFQRVLHQKLHPNFHTTFFRNDMTMIDNPLLKNTVDAVKTSTKNRLAFVKLNRIECFNALNMEMIELLDETFERMIQDPYITSIILGAVGDNFSVGLDFYQLYQKVLVIKDGKRRINYEDLSFGREFFQKFYRFLYRLHLCKKAILCLCPGMLVGNAISLANIANGVMLRFPITSFPAARMGFFPDAGLARLLSNIDYNLGLFFAMTGYEFEPYELVHHGLITNYTFGFKTQHQFRVEGMSHDPNIERNELLKAFREIDSGFIRTGSEFNMHIYLREQVFDAFSHDDVETIMYVVRQLSKSSIMYTEFWIEIYQNLIDANPLSLKVIHRYFKMAKNMTLEENLKMDYRIALNFLRYPDFYRGIFTKYNNNKEKPKWRIANIDEISDEMVSKFFELPPGEKDLDLRGLDTINKN